MNTATDLHRHRARLLAVVHDIAESRRTLHDLHRCQRILRDVLAAVQCANTWKCENDTDIAHVDGIREAVAFIHEAVEDEIGPWGSR